MKILSLFDGISCARVALERVGIPVEAYYASEVDKYAIQIATKNYPATIQLGSVVGLIPPKDIDLLIGGSPCQDLSIAKKDRWIHAKNCGGRISPPLYPWQRLCPKYHSGLGFNRATCYESLERSAHN